MTIETLTLANLEKDRKAKLKRLRELHRMNCPYHLDNDLNEEYRELAIDIHAIDRKLGSRAGATE